MVLAGLLQQPAQGSMRSGPDFFDRLVQFFFVLRKTHILYLIRVLLAQGIQSVEIAVEHLHFQSESPPFPELLLVFRIGKFFSISLEVFLFFKIKALIEDRIDELLHLADTIIEQLHAGIGQNYLAALQFIVDMGCKGIELLDVSLQEKPFSRVQLAKIQIENLA